MEVNIDYAGCCTVSLLNGTWITLKWRSVHF